MAESSNPLSFGAVVREYILPYNTLFAISGVLAFLLSLVSALLVVAFGVSLLCIALLIIIAHHFGKDALLAWANCDDGQGIFGKRCVRLLWPDAHATLRSSGIFWVILVTGIAVTLYGATGVHHRDIARSTDASNADSLTSGGPPRILVLPIIVNGALDTDRHRAIASGVSDDIIRGLSRLPAVRVLGRQTSLAASSSNIDHATLRDTHSVRYVVNGGFEMLGDHFQLDVGLLDTVTGETIWSERLSGPMSQVVDLGEQVVEKLASRIMSSDVRRARNMVKPALSAYELTVRARELWRRPSPDSLAEAQNLLRQALAIDPGYSPAYTDLAFTHFTAYTYGWSEEFGRAETLRVMLMAANKAVELDPSSATARAAQAIAYTYLGRHEEGLIAAREALKLGGSEAENLARVGQILSFSGEHDDAIKVLQNALELDPLGPPHVLESLSRAHFFTGNHEAAIARARDCLDRSPIARCRETLAAALASAGRTGDAGATWAEIAAKRGNFHPEQLVSPLRPAYKRSDDLEGLLAALVLARDAAEMHDKR